MLFHHSELYKYTILLLNSTLTKSCGAKISLTGRSNELNRLLSMLRFLILVPYWLSFLAAIFSLMKQKQRAMKMKEHSYDS